jgi:hypothetical protein
MVRILREGDYRVTIDGEVYGPYQPTLTLGHVVWNDGVLALLAVGAVIRWTLLCAFGVAAVLWLCVAVLPRTTKQAPNAAGQPTVEQRNLPRAEQLPPAQELVLPYPDPRGRVGRFIFFVVLWLLLVGGPVAGTYSWFHLPGGAPVSWIPVVVLAGFGVGFGWLLSRVVIR